MESQLYSPKTVFITGATGFIGSHLARRFLASGYTVEALKRPESSYGLLSDIATQVTWHEGDVTDIPSLEAAIKPGCDVVHAAAIVSFVSKDRPQMEKINVEGTANMVNVCLKAGVRKLGYISSVAALGRPVIKKGQGGQLQVVAEDQKWEDSPNNSYYAQTKYRAELEVWRGEAEGLNVVMVNPSIVLGAGDWSRSSSQLFKYVNDEKRFYPAGLVNYVDVQDVADVLYQLMVSHVSSERFILNAGTIPYKALLEKIAVVLKKRPPTTHISPTLAEIGWRLEAIRSFLTGKPPLITRETARSASALYQFNGSKINHVIDFQYKPLSETLELAVSAFRR